MATLAHEGAVITAQARPVRGWRALAGAYVAAACAVGAALLVVGRGAGVPVDASGPGQGAAWIAGRFCVLVDASGAAGAEVRQIGRVGVPVGIAAHLPASLRVHLAAPVVPVDAASMPLRAVVVKVARPVAWSDWPYVAAASPGASGRAHLGIVPAGAAVAVGGWSCVPLNGALPAGADDLVSMPASWYAVPLPAGYVADDLAALAIARGAALAYESGQWSVGGAVLITRAGRTRLFATDAAAREWVGRGMSRLGMMSGGLAVRGAGRAAWVVEVREGNARRAAEIMRAASRVEDAGRRAALVADARWLLRAV